MFCNNSTLIPTYDFESTEECVLSVLHNELKSFCTFYNNKIIYNTVLWTIALEMKPYETAQKMFSFQTSVFPQQHTNSCRLKWINRTSTFNRIKYTFWFNNINDTNNFMQNISRTETVQ